MPLIGEVGDHRDDYDPKEHDTQHVRRRFYCDGCGLGVAYEPHQWVYGPEQVAAWFEEHKDHKTRGKK